MELQQLTELQGKLDEVRDRVAKAFEEAKTEKDGLPIHDFELIKVYGTGKENKPFTTAELVEKVNQDNLEMNDLGKQIEPLILAKGAYDRLNAPVNTMIHPAPADGSKASMVPGGQPAPFKSLGDQIVDTEQFKQWAEAKGVAKQGAISMPDYGLWELKTLFETSAGWSPESVRSGRVTLDAQRPIELIDLIPSGTLDQAAYVYMEETTLTNNAAETAEGATYKEMALALTERSDTVRKITNSIPVTDEQLEDESAARSYLNMRVPWGIRQKLDSQILNGTGAAPQLRGILNKSGIQTQAKGADPVPDAIFKAMTLVRTTGWATPTAVVMHPNDWQTIRLLRTADGIYIWGNPSASAPEMIWGLPVVQSSSIAENTGLVGSFSEAWIQLLERSGMKVDIGYTGSQFVEGEQTIRASLRVVLPIYRAAAFCTVTGI